MPKYVFITKTGKVLRKTISPSQATKFGEQAKIYMYGLASKMVYPKHAIKRLRRKKR